MLVKAELYIGPEAMDTPLAKQKQRLFEQVVATVKSGFLKFSGVTAACSG